jgi:hypothetical protein
MFSWFNKEAWQLCYKASRDGWNAKDFHSNCDNKGPTITLVKVDENIFGGYIDIDWKGNYVWLCFNCKAQLQKAHLIKQHKQHNAI